ncbi:MULTISPECIES: LapA family protein [unclassified Pseudodesulfovibrio]|uniref:lipopolysaccharide assembly protein LapA domain-containing protein n=1 Tax=unclassified Pseudodesulfovibrio TaxID=2661612 RepID=UPI000FEBD5EA|nr:MULTISPECIES: LapA family protein [unclassified Pseudodesulfovibrio]MCJ2163344.1 LapA family protein [Pseudodesulfovibrio sp. S3-i]RWU06583.1 LapA family protein [Pseudodesulfovibrio sp. S3]
MENALSKIKQRVHIVLTVFLTTLFILFLVQNTEQVQVAFLFWSFSTPRALLLLATLFIGIIIGLLTVMGRPKKNTARKQ